MATRNPNLNLSLAAAKRAAAAQLGADAAAADAELRGRRGEWWWTGKHPRDCPGFDAAAGVLRSLPLPNAATATRRELVDYFDNCWATTEVLFACLQGSEAFVRQPYHQLRHPMIFYYAHTAVVYVNKFRVAGLLTDPIDPLMEQLFEVGVDEMSWDDLSQAKDDWPPVRAAWAYRREAYSALRRVLEEHPCFDGPAAWGNLAWAAHMGFEHERIHVETSSVLIRELPLAFVRRPEFWPEYHPAVGAAAAESAGAGGGGSDGNGLSGAGAGERRHPSEGADYPANPLVPVAGARVALGKPRSYPSYGWDNEYGSKAADVPAFRASAFKVTNGEFHAFVRAGGYSERRWWTDDGWGWRTFRNAKWPTFWVPDGPAGLHRYKLRVLFDAVDMHWKLPAVVNYHEASAFLAWRAARDGSPVAYRMVTEAEHMLLRDPRYRADYGSTYAGAKAAAAADVAANGSGDGKAADATNGGGSDKAGANGRHAAAANGHHHNHHDGGDSCSSDISDSDDGCCAALDAAAAAASPDPAMLAGGAAAPAKLGFNVQLAYSSESPVDAFAPSPAGFYDTFGSVWEWAEDHFAALPGFEVHPYYDDFSAPCFGGLHHMIVGGSFVSTGQLASKYARYQFRPHFFQHAGFRVVAPEADLSQYDLAGRGGSEAPVRPFFETSCMDAPPPYVGTRPCCSKGRRERFTPTMAEAAALEQARVAATKASYETDDLMGQYLSLHYGPVDKVLAEFAEETGVLATAFDFPLKCAELVTKWAASTGAKTRRALDVGCAVGRSTFELARVYGEVVGVDISQTFVDAANAVKEAGQVSYGLKIEGDLTEPVTAVLDPALDRQRCRFLQGDACALPAECVAPGGDAGGGGGFDAVLAANLLCRVPSPAAALQQADAALAPGGLLVLTSPFTWMEAYTERSKWVGGRRDDADSNGAPVRCADALKAALGAMGYEVLDEGRQPLVIRETVRKYQLILAHRLVARKAGGGR